jgi:hypothetical protein
LFPIIRAKFSPFVCLCINSEFQGCIAGTSAKKKAVIVKYDAARNQPAAGLNSSAPAGLCTDLSTTTVDNVDNCG